MIIRTDALKSDQKEDQHFVVTIEGYLYEILSEKIELFLICLHRLRLANSCCLVQATIERGKNVGKFTMSIG